MIKGHTKIELTDVKTGEVEVVEKHNMVTNGLATMMQSPCGLGTVQAARIDSNDSAYPPSIYPNPKSINILNKLLSGIFLFEDMQEENVDGYAPTGDNELVGRGSTFAYTGEDTMLGSYNLAESGWQEDGSYKKVWDFNETQANGQISSLSLTTEAAGTLGFGSKFDGVGKPITMEGNIYAYADTYVYGSKSILLPYTTDGAQIGNYAYSLFCHANGDKNRIMFFDPDNLFDYNIERFFAKTGILNIYSFQVPFTKTGPFLDVTYLNKWNKFQVEIPTEIISQCVTSKTNCVSWFVERDVVYLILNSERYVHAGQTLKILKLNINTMTTEVIRFTNNTSVTMILAYPSLANVQRVGSFSAGLNGGATWIHDGYLFFHAGYNNNTIKGDGKIYRINLQNQADISCVQFNGRDFIHTDMSDLYCLGAKTIVGDYAFVIKARYEATKSHVFVLNMKKNKIYTIPGNQGFFINFNYDVFEFNIVSLFSGNHNMLLKVARFNQYMHQYNSSIQITPFAYSHTLMTINNLSSPVVKTPDKTMRVTYIISEAPDEPTEPTV